MEGYQISFIKPIPSPTMLDFKVVIKEVDAFVDNHIKGYHATVTNYKRITGLIQEYFREYEKKYPGNSFENSTVAKYLDQDKFFGCPQDTYGTPDEFLAMIAHDLQIPVTDYMTTGL
jgi:hypothetical protein